MDNYFRHCEGVGRGLAPAARGNPFPPGAYFLTDEKVGKESPRTFRTVLGLSRRPKGEAD